MASLPTLRRCHPPGLEDQPIRAIEIRLRLIYDVQPHETGALPPGLTPDKNFHLALFSGYASIHAAVMGGPYDNRPCYLILGREEFEGPMACVPPEVET